jgi:hypothetical protein
MPEFERVVIGDATLSLGLPFVGCEIDPEHFAVACARIQQWHDTHGPGAPVREAEAAA